MMVNNEKRFEVDGLKTRAGVRRRVEKYVKRIPERDRPSFRWVMAINDAGEFYPIAVHYPSYLLADIIHAGICVT